MGGQKIAVDGHWLIHTYLRDFGESRELFQVTHPLFNNLGYDLFLGKETPKLLEKIKSFADRLQRRGIKAKYYFDPDSNSACPHKVSNDERKA